MQYREKNQEKNPSPAFTSAAYPFSSIPIDHGAPQIQPKTSICLTHSLSSKQLQQLTSLNHPHLINLKRVSKVKSTPNSPTHTYWLYYEYVNTSLRDKPINTSTLKANLEQVLEFLESRGIGVAFEKHNIGVTGDNEVKVYISPSDVLHNQRLSTQYLKENINKICQQFDEESSPQRSQSANFMPKFMLERKNTLPTNIKKIRDAGNVNPEDRQKRLQNINSQLKLIQNRIKKTTNNPAQEKVNEKNMKNNTAGKKLNFLSQSIDQTPQPQEQNYSPMQYIPAPYHDFDTQSVDTYMMQMGEDFQMPSIKNNVKLRQTNLSPKKDWDSYTVRAPRKKQSKNEEFLNLVKQSQNKIGKNKTKKKEKMADCQTVRERFKEKPKNNWPTQTFRSENSPNIKHKVSQALTKAKNVMQLLKKHSKGAA